MTRRWRILVLGLLGLVVLILGTRPVGAAGPWRGQVIDAESAQPLEGVIVVAVWDKLSPGVIHPGRDFHDALEVVTDSEGRFIIPARSLTTLNPFVNFEPRSLVFFKSAYTWSGIRNVPLYTSRDEIWKLMEKDSATFELRPLRTKQERLNALRRPGDVPDSLIPRYLDAYGAESVQLGLKP